MNIVIGDSSQLFPYFREIDSDIIGVPARNFDVKKLNGQKFDRAFITFAEQRTYSDEGLNFFTPINVDYTIKVINEMIPYVKTFVVYSTSDLWDLCEGPITLDTPFNNRGTPYVLSKILMMMEIDKLRADGVDIKIVYPFNFSSPNRKSHFLFHKFMEVILYGKKITVGDLNFSRDIIHPKVVAEISLNTETDVIVGSGVLTNVRQFYLDLLKSFNIIYDDYVTEDFREFPNLRKSFYLGTENKYTSLLEDTLYDIRKFKNTISQRHN